MPHINSAIKASLADGRQPKAAGELTWKLYTTCLEYVATNGRTFSVFCVVIGSLVCTVLELYRRKVAVYEDEKILENGEA